MFNHSSKLDEETIRVYNGQSVMDAIASQNDHITEDELLKQFITSTDAPRDLIEHELRQILHNGVVGGFIVKTGNIYAIPTLEKTYAADCDESEGDESKDDEREGEEKEYAISISIPDRPDVTVKVEPGTSTSSATRKRAATGPSPYEHSPKKVKICPEAVELSIKLRKGAYEFGKGANRRMEIFKPSLFSIDEKHDVKHSLKRPPFVEGGLCAKDDVSEEEDEEEEEDDDDDDGGGPVLKDERRDDDDEDPSACGTGTALRKSKRKIIPAKGKCGGRSHPSKCSF